MADLNPICIILVTTGPKAGSKLLFRYPFEGDVSHGALLSHRAKVSKRTLYGVKFLPDDQANQQYEQRNKKSSSVDKGTLVGYTDEILAHLLTVHSNLVDRKFDVKIEDVRFIGFPKPLPKSDQITSFNVVFALRSSVSESVVTCYHSLAQQLTVAIKHEDRRCGYLSRESKIMLGVQDEVAAMPEDSMESPFRNMLPQSSLARTLQTVYDSLVTKGVVQLHINRWIQINFCLPHKIYSQLAPKGYSIEPEAVRKCLSAIRPYHSVLLLVEEKDLMDCLPVDCTPTLPKLMQVISPLKSLQSLALDADISLTQVFRLVCHLVYWGKALIIYPLCKSNVYVITPHAQTHVIRPCFHAGMHTKSHETEHCTLRSGIYTEFNLWCGYVRLLGHGCLSVVTQLYRHSQLTTSFTELFPGTLLLPLLSEFSLPTSLGQERDVLRHPQQQKQKVQMVIWMLQHQLLTQLHTYIYLMPGKHHSDYTTSANTSPAKSTLTPNLDDFQVAITSSFSDVASANSDDSTQRTTSLQMSKSPSIEASSDITDDMRNDWRQAEWVLANFNQSGRNSVLQLVASLGIDDFKLFIRLCPYFNGKHHLEEIMYYENVRRSSLVTLLDKLRDVLVTCIHHDPATTFYMK